MSNRTTAEKAGLKKVRPKMRSGEIRHDLKEQDIAQHSGDFNMSWRTRNLPIEAENVFEHWCYFKDESKKTPLLKLDRVPEPKPAIVIGSGGSLDYAVPYLKDWEHAIFCSSSHLSTLARYDCYADYFASPDPRGHINELLNLPEDKLKILHEKTTFAQCPIGPYKYTVNWPGRMRWFLIMDPGKDWYANAIAPNFPWIPESLLPFSANAPALIAIAQYLGYAPIYLVGTDFSGKRYDNWEYIDDKWKEQKGTTSEGNLGYQKTYHGLHSSMNLMWAWRGMLCVLRLAISELKGVYWHVYNCCPNGALQDELPYRDIREVISRQGADEKMEWSKQKTRTMIDLGLARFNTFCFTVHNGERQGNRLEMAKSWEDLGRRIDGINGMIQTTVNIYNNAEPKDQRIMRKTFKLEKVKLLDRDKTLEYCRYLKERVK